MTESELHKQIGTPFIEWLEEGDQTDQVVDQLIKLSKEHKFSKPKVQNAFNKFMQESGAEGDMLEDITKCAMIQYTDIILKNKTVFWPEAEPPKTKLKLGGKKNTTEPPTEPVNVVVASVVKATKGGKKVVKAKRLRGYDVFFNEKKVSVKANFETEWKEEFPGKDYTSNPTAVSKELGKQWKLLTDAEKKEYNDNAAATNTANGVEPKTSKTRNNSEKKPLTAYQAYNKKVYHVMAEKYLADNPDAETVAPPEVMRLTAASWKANIKDNEVEKAKYQKIADEINDAEGRQHQPKAKKGKDLTKKTTGYREFCDDFRKNGVDGLEKHLIAYTMNKKWNEEIKTDEDKQQHWQQVADDENLRRGIIV